MSKPETSTTPAKTKKRGRSGETEDDAPPALADPTLLEPSKKRRKVKEAPAPPITLEYLAQKLEDMQEQLKELSGGQYTLQTQIEVLRGDVGRSLGAQSEEFGRRTLSNQLNWREEDTQGVRCYNVWELVESVATPRA